MRAVRNILKNFPRKVWFFLALFALAIQITIDAWMGISAEYFNAAHVFLAFREMLTSGTPQNVHFLLGQETLGFAALPLASLILLFQPCVIAFIIILLWRVVANGLAR